MSTSSNDDDNPYADLPGWLGPLRDNEDEDGYPNIFGGMFGGHDDETEHEKSKSIWQFLGAIVVVLFLIILVLYVLYNFVIFSIFISLKSIPNLYSIPVVTFFSLLIAGGLFWLREKDRLKYGVLEVGSGIFTTLVSVGAAMNDNRKWLIVLTAIYVIVRGFDNVNIGTGYKWLAPFQPPKRKHVPLHNQVQPTNDSEPKIE